MLVTSLSVGFTVRMEATEVDTVIGRSRGLTYAFNQETGPVTWCEVRVDGKNAKTELSQTLWLSEKEQYKQYAAHLWLNKYGDGGSSN